MSEKKQSANIAYSNLGQRAHSPVITDLMHRALHTPGLLSLAAGFTDNETLPRALIENAVLELGRVRHDLEYLQYCSNQGRSGLLNLLTERLNGYAEETTGTFTAQQLMITNGSQQALYLAMQSLCNAGDIVLVEEPSYFVFLELLQGLGIEAVPMSTMHSDALHRQFERMQITGDLHRVKAVYIQGYFANPSSHSLSTEAKTALANALLQAGLRIPVIEDAAYRELYFEAPHPVSSVFSLKAYTAFPKLYLGTCTKPFATGFKIGYGVCSDPEWLSKMLAIKGHQDFGSANFTQAILEAVIKSGAYDQHLDQVRVHYQKKADIMGDVLQHSDLRQLGWNWTNPQGGLYYWLQGPQHIDTRMGEPLCEACIERGVLYVPGNLCKSVPNEHSSIRLSFGALPTEKLKEATQRFVEVVQAFEERFKI